MKKIIFYLLIIGFVNFSCNQKKDKSYWDYNENDFYMTQGIISDIKLRYDYLKMRHLRDVYFIYHLDFEKPMEGVEKGTDYRLNIGEPVIILVHKKDSSISFFGHRGLVDERMKIDKEVQENDTIPENGKNIKIFEFK